MNIGMGLFLLGVYIALAAALASSNITNVGLKIMQGWAIVATLLAFMIELYQS